MGWSVAFTWNNNCLLCSTNMAIGFQSNRYNLSPMSNQWVLWLWVWSRDRTGLKWVDGWMDGWKGVIVVGARTTSLLLSRLPAVCTDVVNIQTKSKYHSWAPFTRGRKLLQLRIYWPRFWDLLKAPPPIDHWLLQGFLSFSVYFTGMRKRVAF